MASMRQQSFVTVLLIMLMQPHPRSLRWQRPTTLTHTRPHTHTHTHTHLYTCALVHARTHALKEQEEKERSAQTPLRHMNILSGEFYNSVSLHACGLTLHTAVHTSQKFSPHFRLLQKKKKKKKKNTRRAEKRATLPQ